MKVSYFCSGKHAYIDSAFSKSFLTGNCAVVVDSMVKERDLKKQCEEGNTLNR